MDARVTDFAAADAKARFSELLARAEAGEEIVIRRHGKPIAKLVPTGRSKLIADPEERERRVGEWLAYLRAHGPRLGSDLTIRQLVDEGRK